MIQITITKNEVRNMKGIGKTSQKPYDFNIQTGYAHVMDEQGVLCEFPEKFEFTLPNGQAPYERGLYTVAPSSIFVGRDGHLEFRTILSPVQKVAKTV